jgi:serine/threonine protein kinase
MADLLDRLKTALSGRYTVERELGTGGMATVFLAQDLKHRRPVAIKVLLPDLAEAVESAGSAAQANSVRSSRTHHHHAKPRGLCSVPHPFGAERTSSFLGSHATRRAASPIPHARSAPGLRHQSRLAASIRGVVARLVTE